MRLFGKKKYQPARQDISAHIAAAKVYIAARMPEPKPVPSSPRIQYSLRDDSLWEEPVLEQYLKTAEKKPSFSETVLKLMAEKDLQPKEFYGRAGLDRRLFSSLKNGGAAYQPSRNTALRCCFALQLSSQETDDLLKQAGYALSESRKDDVLIHYCIENKIWNLFDVDELLYAFGESPLFK